MSEPPDRGAEGPGSGQRSAAVAEFWSAFVTVTGTTGPYTAWGFADDAKPELMTKLGLLVRDGPKRATAGLETDYAPAADRAARADATVGAGAAPGAEPLPRVGDHSVVLDGEGRPLCIIRTTAVEIRPFGEVDEAFAWDEGENDRTLAGWRAAHEWYFASVGTPVDDDTRVVLERFAKVWPPPVDPVG